MFERSSAYVVEAVAVEVALSPQLYASKIDAEHHWILSAHFLYIGPFEESLVLRNPPTVAVEQVILVSYQYLTLVHVLPQTLFKPL